MKDYVLLSQQIGSDATTVLRIYRKEHHEQAKLDHRMLSNDLTSKKEFMIFEVEVFDPTPKVSEETDHRPMLEIITTEKLELHELVMQNWKWHHSQASGNAFYHHYELPYGEMDALEYLRAVALAFDVYKEDPRVIEIHFLPSDRNFLMQTP